MLVLHVALDSLGAEAALIEREVLPRFKSDYAIVFDFELNAALLAAEAAVSFDHAIRLDVGAPPGRGHSVQRRSELTNEICDLYR